MKRKNRIDEDEAYALMSSAVDAFPYGAHFTSSDRLYDAFIKPFTDVFHVAAGKTKELSVKTQTFFKTIFEVIATSLIPILADDFEEIFENEHKKLEQIKQEYGKYYDATWEVFRDNDVAVSAFFFNPAAFLTYELFAKKGPRWTMSLLSTLSGGRVRVPERFRSSLPGRRSSAEGPGMPLGDGGGGFGAYESLTREQNILEEVKLSKLIRNKAAIADILEKNSELSELSEKVQAAVKASLVEVLQKAKKISSATKLDDIEKMIGKNITQIDKLRKLPEKQIAPVSQKILSTVKKSAIKLYIDNLKRQRDIAIEAGIPATSQYVVLYNNVINKLAQMA